MVFAILVEEMVMCGRCCLMLRGQVRGKVNLGCFRLSEPFPFTCSDEQALVACSYGIVFFFTFRIENELLLVLHCIHCEGLNSSGLGKHALLLSLMKTGTS